MKSVASEMLIILAVLASLGIALVQLQKISIQGVTLLQAEPLSRFGNEIENILKQLSASTSEYAYYVYQPPLLLYEMNITRNKIIILDKKAGKLLSIENVFGFDFEKNSIDDAKMIYIVKNQTRVFIFESCREVGESCEFHLQCCENYCWGSEDEKTCHDSCAPLGAYAASPNDCCSGYLNESYQCDNPKVCSDEQICNGATKNTYKDDLGHTCCIDGYVCSYEHCCPKEKPYWCEKPKTGNSRCMNESEYANDCNDYCKYPCVPNCKLPPEWDWRNVKGKNYLNPVRNQGFCGSCWAFSAVGSIEGTYNVEAGCPACNKDLSEQCLISNNPPCCGYCGSCNGGWPHAALDYAKRNGIVDEFCCPYFSSSAGLVPVQKCPICRDYLRHRWMIRKFGYVSNRIDEIKRALICHGPLSVASMNWRHAIVLVGYNDSKNVWIIRNSWGPSWGDHGYGYIPYSGHPFSDLKNYVLYVEEVLPPK